MRDAGQPRFFVTVSASRADDLRRLQAHGMDLFSTTARQHKARTAQMGRAARPFAIDGLLDEAEIAKLRSEGYDVTVDAPMAERTVQPGDTLEFEAWHARMRELTAKDGEVK